MKFFYSIIFCLSLAFCQGQNDFGEKLDVVLSIESDSIRAIKLEGLEKEYSSNKTELMGLLYHKLGVAYRKQKLYLKAIESTEKAVTIRKSVQEVNYGLLDKSLYGLYTMYKYTGDNDKKIKALERVTEGGYNSSFDVPALRNICKHYITIGDYFKALEYAERIIKEYPNHKKQKQLAQAHRLAINIYSKIGLINEDFLERVNYHRGEFEKIISKSKPINRISFYSNLGVIYRGIGDKEQALFSYEKALQNALTDKIPESIVNSIYVNIGEIYSQLKEAEKADDYYQKVLSTTDSINISAVFNNIGYYHTKSIDEEIRLHQKAIQLLGVTSNLLESSSFLEEIRNSSLKEELLLALIDLSQAFIELYNENKDVKNLNKALKIIYRIDDLISLMRLDSGTKASKLFWIERGVNSYLEAVKVCYLLNKPAEAFYFMEKNKSLYLLEQLGKLQLKNEYKIPAKLLEKEINLNYEILLAKNKLNKDSESVSFQDVYYEVIQKHSQFTDSLKKIFPNYYKSSLKPELVSLNDFQKFLKEKNSHAVEYILGEKEGYGLWMNENELHFFQLENYSKLVENISFLKQVFTNPSLTKEEVSAYKKIGFETFEILFPFKEAREQIKTKQLKIIPSGILYNFQFESLIVDQKPVLKDNFLIHLAELSYLNSASVSKNIYNTEFVNSHSYLGVAPVNFSSQELVNLKGSENTIKEIASLFSSKVKLKEKATRKEFLNTLEEALIFHVNTHAGIDQETKLPWLSMNDTIVSLEELYIKNRPHHLVFLDACKTADGKLQRGEGIESLSRAFFHSGSKSVIASQWNANEKATNKISLSFFKELKLGKTKSEALRQAKLNYLEESQLSTAFPYFWASLTLTGNSDALPEVSYRLDYWILVAFLLLILIVLYRKKKNFKS